MEVNRLWIDWRVITMAIVLKKGLISADRWQTQGSQRSSNIGVDQLFTRFRIALFARFRSRRWRRNRWRHSGTTFSCFVQQPTRPPTKLTRPWKFRFNMSKRFNCRRSHFRRFGQVGLGVSSPLRQSRSRWADHVVRRSEFGRRMFSRDCNTFNGCPIQCGLESGPSSRYSLSSQRLLQIKLDAGNLIWFQLKWWCSNICLTW